MDGGLRGGRRACGRAGDDLDVCAGDTALVEFRRGSSGPGRMCGAAVLARSGKTHVRARRSVRERLGRRNPRAAALDTPRTAGQVVRHGRKVRQHEIDDRRFDRSYRVSRGDVQNGAPGRGQERQTGHPRDDQPSMTGNSRSAATRPVENRLAPWRRCIRMLADAYVIIDVPS